MTGLDPDVPGRFAMFRDKVAKMVPWMRKAYCLKHPTTGSQTYRAHLHDTFISYAMFGVKVSCCCCCCCCCCLVVFVDW